MKNNIFFKKEYVINLAMLIFFLGIISLGSAILAQSALFQVPLFTNGFGGSNIQGNYGGRTYLTYSTGTANAQGSTYIGNIGFFGNSQYSTAAPTILSASITPPIVSINQAISLFINARYASNVSANITLPNNSNIIMQLANAQNNTFTNTSLAGNYSVSFIARNNFGNRTYNLSFITTSTVLFNITITDDNSSNLTYNFVAEAFNYIYAQNQSSGLSQVSLPQTLFNLEIDSQEYAKITLRGINVSSESNKQLLLDKYDTSEYLTVRAVNNSFNITNATIRISYENLSVVDEGRLKLFVCHDYAFSNRTCEGTWDDITTSAINDQVNNYFEYETLEFSAFSILETAEPQAPVQSVPERAIGFFSVRRDMVIKQEVNCDQIKLTLFDEEQNHEVYPTQLYLGRNDELSSKYYIDNEGGILIKLEDGKYRLVAKSRGYFDQELEFEIDCKQEPVEEPVLIDDDQIENQNNQDDVSGFVIGVDNLPDEQKPEEITEDANQEVIQTPEEYKKTVMKDARTGLALILIGFILSAIIVIKISKLYLYDSRTALFEKIMAKRKEMNNKKTADLKAKPIEKKLPALKIPIDKTIMKPISDYVVAPKLSEEPTIQKITPKEPVVVIKPTVPISEEQALIEKARLLPELREVEVSESFVLSDGRKVNSTLSLANELSKMDEYEFKKFVNEYKNDFAKWIYDVIKDPVLAKKLGVEKRREQSRRIILERIGELLGIK